MHCSMALTQTVMGVKDFSGLSVYRDDDPPGREDELKQNFPSFGIRTPVCFMLRVPIKFRSLLDTVVLRKLAVVHPTW
jgi:hypothetical protein